MSTDPPIPVITVAKFNRDHDNPNGAPPGSLHRRLHSRTLGFLRGRNLSVGDYVRVSNEAQTKIWSGTITSSVGDQWSGRMGPAWLFDLQTILYTPDPELDDTIRVSVTVSTQALPVQTSDPHTPSPDPTTVP